MKIIAKQTIFIVIALALIVTFPYIKEFTADKFDAEAVPAAEITAEPETEQPQETQVTEPVIETTVTDNENLLDEEQKALLLQYAQIYAESITSLEPGNVKPLYYDGESKAGRLNAAAFEVICAVRKMSDDDLTLEKCAVNYDIKQVYGYNGRVTVVLMEDNVQKFKFLDQPSESYIIYHEFVLAQKDDGWYIVSHRHDEDFYLLTEEAWPLYKAATEKETAESVVAAIIADAEENVQWEKDNYLNKTEEKTADDTSYNTEEAVKYAHEWVGERNYTGAYLAYDDFGGNCQNFASQCLYAGGLDMDVKGYSASQWKFYSKTLNEYQSASGRSYSWTGVVPFFDYCEANTGKGLVTHTDWGTAYTEVGDIIQVGAMHQWRHSLFVTDVIYDDNGYAQQIIVASNTADRINYPLSAYIYTAPRLIHIVGQNV